MTLIFDIHKCDVPPLEKLPTSKFITDCSIPAPPDPIQHCPDMNSLLDLQSQIGPIIIPPDGSGTPQCPPPLTGLQFKPAGIPHFDEFSLPMDSIGFRRSSSFYMWVEPSVTCPGRFNVLVDIGGGPADSVFWQPPGGGPPLWTQCPIIGQGLVLGASQEGPATILMFNKDKRFALTAGPVTQGWVTPSNEPPGLYSYLYADSFCQTKVGKILSLKWSRAGVTGQFMTYSGQTISVVGGIITSIGGSSPTVMPNGTCDLGPCDIAFEPGTNNQTKCPPGTHWDIFRQACVPDAGKCPPGTTWNPQTQTCDPNNPCPPGTHWDPQLLQCVKDTQTGPPDCPPGTHWDSQLQKCVQDQQGNPKQDCDGYEMGQEVTIDGIVYIVTAIDFREGQVTLRERDGTALITVPCKVNTGDQNGPIPEVRILLMTLTSWWVTRDINGKFTGYVLNTQFGDVVGSAILKQDVPDDCNKTVNGFPILNCVLYNCNGGIGTPLPPPTLVDSAGGVPCYQQISAGDPVPKLGDSFVLAVQLCNKDFIPPPQAAANLPLDDGIWHTL